MATGAQTEAQLDGELSFASVPHWLQQADTLLASGSLDLGRVTRADSAGLALLLELSRRIKARGGALKLRGAPVQLIELARFFGLETLLAFEHNEASTGGGS